MSEIFTFTVDGEGVGHLVFDLPGEKLNKFTEESIRALDQKLDEISKKNLKVLLISSGKPGSFIAGADIHLIEKMTSEDEVYKQITAGHRIYEKMESLSCPLVALIDGVCLGGGLEFVLACDYRIVTDNPKTSLGLPEVKLGVIPGWGGTQRLPKLVGLRKSLDMILTGKTIPAKKAWKIGLADTIVNEEFQNEQTADFLKKVIKGKPIKRNNQSGVIGWLLDGNPIGRKLVCHLARKNILKKTGGHYPAPLAALDVIESNGGYDAEKKHFAKLAVGPISKNLIRIFFTTESVKKDAREAKERSTTEIKQAAVLGGGMMGGGIAWLFSKGDIGVRIKDVNWDAVSKGFQQAADIYKQLIKIRKYKPAETKLKMDHISGTLDYKGFDKEDLIVEAIVENIDVKKKVYQELEPQIREDAIVCSNTSTFSINEMAQSFKKPDRFVGMHFFNPVNRMPLVEVISGKETSQETLDTAVALLFKLGKTPMVVQDCPGFLVNRILFHYFNSAMALLAKGADIEFIDRTMTKFGMPMGPFTLIDAVGLDIAYKGSLSMEKAYGKRMPQVLPEVSKVMDEGLLGKKVGKGFYYYQGKKKNGPNPKVRQLLGLKNETIELQSQDVVDHHILPMVNEAARCIDDGIVERVDYLDLAMIMGTGFPPFRGGLLRYADERGLSEVVATLDRLAEEDAGRFAPAESLRKRAEQGKTFYPPQGE